MIDRAEEHLGDRARRALPAQVLPLVRRAAGGAAKEVAEELQRSADLARARELIGGLAAPAAVA